jgi:hypothetical protein
MSVHECYRMIATGGASCRQRVTESSTSISKGKVTLPFLSANLLRTKSLTVNLIAFSGARPMSWGPSPEIRIQALEALVLNGFAETVNRVLV